MTDTQRTIEAVGSPLVTLRVSDYGQVSGELVCWRTKRNGDEEQITVKFDQLEAFNLACIGRSARTALDRKGRVDWQRNRDQLKQVTG